MNDLKAVEKEPDKIQAWPEIEPWPAMRDLTVADPGEGPGGPGPPLFSHQNEARSAEKMFFETGPPLSKGLDDRPPTSYLKVWIRHCLTCPKDLVYIYTIFFEIYIEFLIRRLYIVCETLSKHTVIYAPSLHHFDLSF